MLYCIFYSILIGPYVSASEGEMSVLIQLPKKPINITILISTKSLNKDIERYSKIILYEIGLAPGFQFQKLYLNAVTTIDIVEWRDINCPNVPSLPCFKFGKNNPWELFPENTFLSSGCFMKTLCSIIYVDNYLLAVEQFEIEISDFWDKNSCPFISYEQKLMLKPHPPVFNSWFVLPNYYKYDKFIQRKY